MTVSASRSLGRKTLPSAMLLALLSAGGVSADITTLRLPGACVSTPGTTPALTWGTPINATSSTDGQARAATGTLGAGAISDFLRCTGFGFSIPDGSTINGLTLQVQRRRSLSGQIDADGHVQAVLPNGSLGTADLAQTPCNLTNDWGTTFNTATYGGNTATWGTSWGACNAANPTCTVPAGSSNVNHPGFGFAVAAQGCSGTGAAWIDYVQAQLDFTPPACGGAAWGSITVQAPGTLVTNSDIARRQVDYVIQAVTPNPPGCALVGSSKVRLDFSCPGNAGPDTTSITTASMNGTPIPLGTIDHPGGANTLRFTVPAGALGPCSGQNCFTPGTGFTLTLQNVTNPPDAGSCTVTVSATSAANGDTGNATSPAFMIKDPCMTNTDIVPSQWAPLTVALADAGVSLPGCPRHTRFTITTKTPRPSGCALVSANPSTLEIGMPPTANLMKLTGATLKVGTAAPVSVTPTVAAPKITITPTMNIPNDTDLVITLDVVGAPTTPATGQTLTLQAKSTASGISTPTGSSAVTPSSAYAITTAACAPELNFYVRDWTTNATSHDVGNEPSGGPNWALTSDVWNQYTNTPNAPVNDWIAGTQPSTMGNNYAFARISRMTTGAPPAFDRTVTVTFFAAPFGIGPQFGQIGSTTVNLAYDSPMTFVNVPWMPATLPVGADHHICLAVEIDSLTDPVVKNTATQESILGDTPDTASKVRIEGNNNQAQRNLTQVDTPTDFPIPPPPPPPSGGGGGGMWMRNFAVIHNAAIETRDMTLQFEANGDAIAQLPQAQVGVVGDKTVAYEPGGRLVLPAMRPGENRWIGFSYGLTAGGEGELPPIGFVQADGKEHVNGVGFILRRTPLPAVATENLRHHADTFSRLATAFGVGEAKGEGAAAAALVEKGDVSDTGYLAFLEEHQARMEAVVRTFRYGGAKRRPVGIKAALKTLAAAIAEKNPRAAAVSHLALLERLDVAQTIRWLARGNPLDIVQMVRWQRALYTTRPALKDLPVAGAMVKRSDAFLATAIASKPDGRRYAKLMSESMKDFRATAAALKKRGVDLGGPLGVLEKTNTSNAAALEKAHRRYLLALDAGGASGQP